MKKYTLLLLLLFVVSTIHAKTWHVSNQSKRKERGSKKYPYHTIQKAVSTAIAGDTIFVHEGIYRERVVPIRSGKPNAPIVFWAEPGKQVFIKGSDAWSPKWNDEENGVYSATLDSKLFNDIASDYTDHHNPFRVELNSTPHNRKGRKEQERGLGGNWDIVYTCGQVFYKGKQLLEVPFLEELEVETWHYESESNKLYVNFGQTIKRRNEIEITTRRRIFAPVNRGVAHIEIHGFILEHCGNQTNSYSEKSNIEIQQGALELRGGHHWLIKNNVIRHSKASAIIEGGSHLINKGFEDHNNTIEANYILENGASGIVSNGSENLIIRDNIVLRNNTLKFLSNNIDNRAAIKCSHAKNVLFFDNYIANNEQIQGIWLHNEFKDSRICRNIIVNNGQAGIYIDGSDYGYNQLFIDNNILIGNNLNPIYCLNASGVTIANNLFANTPNQEEFGQGYFVKQGPNNQYKTHHHSLYNNLFAGNFPVLDFDYPSHREGSQQIDYNLYDVSEAKPSFVLNKLSDNPSPWNDTEFASLLESELGSSFSSASALIGEKKIALSGPLWQAFWAKHACFNDIHSSYCEGLKIEFEMEKNWLTITLPLSPSRCKIKRHTFLDFDYYGKAITKEGVPGPFQNLKKGVNNFQIWNGLPLVPKGKLPDSKAFGKR